MVLLGLNFFVLSSAYKLNLLEEIFYLVKYGKFSYRDILIIPTFERKFFIDKLVDTFKKS
jgi:hypothetical protein